MRIFVFQVIQRECDAVGQGPRRGNRMGPVCEEAAHLIGRFQVAFGIGLQEPPGAGDGHALPNAGHHVLQRAAVGGGVKHVIGGEDRQAVTLRHPVQPVDPRPVIAAIEVARRDMTHPRQGAEKTRQTGGKALQIGAGQGDEVQGIRRVIRQHLQRQVGFPLLLPLALGIRHLALRQQRRQPRIGGAVPWIGQKLRPAEQFQPRADQGMDAGGLGLAIHPHHTGQGIVIGDPDAVIAKPVRRRRQVHRVRGRAQEREATGQPQFHVTRARIRGEAVFLVAAPLMPLLLRHQAKSPCRNQRGSAPRPSPITPTVRTGRMAQKACQISS